MPHVFENTNATLNSASVSLKPCCEMSILAQMQSIKCDFVMTTKAELAADLSSLRWLLSDSKSRLEYT